MTTYQEKAEKYVREKLPELMELSFGCEFKPKNSEGGHRKVIKVINEYSRGITYTTIYYVSHLAKETPASIGINDFEDMCQIIGHPIQLAHVLRLLVEDWRGEFLEVWDLEKDWNNQEERVYRWLCNEWHL